MTRAANDNAPRTVTSLRRPVPISDCVRSVCCIGTRLNCYHDPAEFSRNAPLSRLSARIRLENTCSRLTLLTRTIGRAPPWLASQRRESSTTSTLDPATSSRHSAAGRGRRDFAPLVGAVSRSEPGWQSDDRRCLGKRHGDRHGAERRLPHLVHAVPEARLRH